MRLRAASMAGCAVQWDPLPLPIPIPLGLRLELKLPVLPALSMLPMLPAGLLAPLPGGVLAWGGLWTMTVWGGSISPPRDRLAASLKACGSSSG